MFSFAFLIGIYSFAILALGVTAQLYKENILLLSLLFVIATLVIFIKEFRKNIAKKEFSKIIKSKICTVFLVIFITQALINLVGVFGPEISYDALWYHLTLPKIYLLNHSIFNLSGSLLYYSNLPKLGEILYIAALSISNEFLAKIIHFSFGILTSFAIYKISRKYIDIKYALMAVVIFYSNLVVGWLSISSYIDLIRTFFEIMAFWAFLEWLETKKTSWIIESALLAGLSLCVKLTAAISVFGFIILIILFSKKESIKTILKRLIIFVLLSLIIPLPYFALSFINTGNPIYPMFQNYQAFSLLDYNFINQLTQGLRILIASSDPISPIYLISIPLIIIFFKKLKKEMKSILIYPFIAFIIIILIPQNICFNCQIGDKTRFLLPYLSIFSIGIVIIFSMIEKGFIKKSILVIVLFLSIISISYRAMANYKFVPYLTNQETKVQFLTKNLNFSFGDFYDTDNFLTRKITGEDKVLLFGFHNLYYVNFPFIDSSWVIKGDTFNYIATQNSELPERFRFWNLIYSNSKTHVNLYTFGGIKWTY